MTELGIAILFSGLAATAIALAIGRGRALVREARLEIASRALEIRIDQLKAENEAAEESINELETVFIASGGDPRRALAARARRIRVLRETDHPSGDAGVHSEAGRTNPPGSSVRGPQQPSGLLGRLLGDRGRELLDSRRHLDSPSGEVPGQDEGED